MKNIRRLEKIEISFRIFINYTIESIEEIIFKIQIIIIFYLILKIKNRNEVLKKSEFPFSFLPV